MTTWIRAIAIVTGTALMLSASISSGHTASPINDPHSSPNAPESGPLYAGIARVDITPNERDAVDLAGHDLKVTDRLFARAVLLDDGKTSLAIVSLDLILFASRNVVEQIKAKWDVDHVLLCSTHTHAAMAPRGLILEPRGGSDWTRAGEDPGEILDWDALSQDPWFAATEEKIVAAVGEARRNLFPARVAAGTEIYESPYMAHNRRLVDEKGRVSMMWANPNRIPTEPTDPTVRIIRIDDTSGRTRALLVHYACHPVMMMNARSLSRDFPGAMVDHIENKLGGDCMAVFLQGAAGDLDPYDLHQANGKHRADLVRNAGRSLAEAALRVAKKLQANANDNASLKVNESLLSLHLRNNKRKTSNVGLTTAVINRDLALVAIPGEPFIQHQLNLAEKSPAENTLVLGYAYSGRGSPFGLYIPTQKAVREGGYGATECSFLAADAGKRMVNEALASIKKLTKK